MAEPIVIKGVTINQLKKNYNIQNVNTPVIQDNQYNGKINQSTFADKELYKSTLGTPVVTDLTLSFPQYTDVSQNKVISGASVKLLTILCTVSQAKKIVKTDIDGRDGSIKEYIGMDDYAVTINGIITGYNGQRPVEQVLALKKVLDAPVPLVVVSNYLNDLGIYNLVVESYDFNQEAGGWSKQDFSITAISDKPLELQII